MNVKNGFMDVVEKIKSLDEKQRSEIEAKTFRQCTRNNLVIKNMSMSLVIYMSMIYIYFYLYVYDIYIYCYLNVCDIYTYLYLSIDPNFFLFFVDLSFHY